MCIKGILRAAIPDLAPDLLTYYSLTHKINQINGVFTVPRSRQDNTFFIRFQTS